METKWIVLFIMSVCLACHEAGADVTTSTTLTTAVPTEKTTGKTSTKITTSSTTVPSSTGTHIVSTATPAPTTPAPPPDVWYTREGLTVCILLSAKITLKFKDSTSISVDHTNGKSDGGHCGKDNQLMIISVTNSSFMVNFTFIHNDTHGTYRISHITVSNFTSKASLSVTTGFWSKDMKENTTYRCEAAETEFKADKTDKSEDFVTGVTLASVRLEAFRNSGTFDFDKTEETCPADKKVSNLVPIVVGAALGGLILIVLIAYLIGRKRSRRGYEQV